MDKTDVTVTIAGRFRSGENYHLTPRVLETEAVFIYTDGGAGLLIDEGVERPVRPGEGFLLFPGHRHEYRTAGKRWDLWWFHCAGPLVAQLWERCGGTSIPPTQLGPESPVEGHMRAVIREYQEKPPLWEAVSGAHARIVLVELVRKAEQGGAGEPGRGAKLVQEAAAYLRENLSRTVTSAELEERFHVSSRHLTRLFRIHTGETPRQYALRAKLVEAQRLLYLTDLTVAEVAARVGVPDPYYFSRLFHRKTGLSPTAYRRSQSASEPRGR